jgi:hypothetical protein
VCAAFWWRSTERGPWKTAQGGFGARYRYMVRTSHLCWRRDNSASNASRLGRWPGRIAVACTGGAGLSWHAAAVPGTPCRQLGRAAAGRAIKAPAVPPSSVSLRCWSLYFEHLQRQRWKGDPPGPSFCAAIGFQYLRNSIRMPFTELYCIPVQILCLNVSDENLVSPVRAF